MSQAIALRRAKILSASQRVITQFTFRRSVIGAILFGVFASIESYAQGRGIVAAFPNVAERAKIIHGLANNAALSIFYGDKSANIISPDGYMVYRIMPILVLVGAIWMLGVTTKMLRGQEDSGRWELLLSGQSAARSATLKTLLGIAGAISVALLLIALLLAAAGHSGKFTLTLGGSFYYALALIFGAVLAVAIGALTSQLAATRRYAMLYGASVIILFFMLRSLGNTVDSLAWIKNLTPFGWIDKLRPFYHPQAVWLLPLGAFTVITIGVALWLAGRRDLGASLIADKESAKPHFKLLASQIGLDFRLSRNVLFGWLLGSVGFAALIASIDKTVAKTLTSSGATKGKIAQTFSNLTGNYSAQMEIAYLSAAGFLIVTLLLVMVTNYVGAVRDEEASGRLDNMIASNRSRGRWLLERLILIISAAVVISLVANFVVWTIASAQGVSVSFATLVLGGLNILGPVMLMLGLGVMIYGFKPRLSVIVMYALIAWSFTVDIIAAALKLSKTLTQTSLLHYVSLVPAVTANWRTFTILTLLGIGGICVGIIGFENRDIQAE